MPCSPDAYREENNVGSNTGWVLPCAQHHRLIRLVDTLEAPGSEFGYLHCAKKLLLCTCCPWKSRIYEMHSRMDIRSNTIRLHRTHVVRFFTLFMMKPSILSESDDPRIEIRSLLRIICDPYIFVGQISQVLTCLTTTRCHM